MAFQHLNYAIVRQGSETMGCWAASMSWYAKAVRQMNYSRDQIAEMYKSLMATPPPGKTIGGMSDASITQLFADFKWRLWQTWADRSNFDMNLIDLYLNASPTLLAFYDPALKGAHMNVIVARVPFTETRFFVMDPDYDSFQIRNLQYYREKSTLFRLASLKSANYN